MSYQKPELVVLKVATDAVRDVAGADSDSSKAAAAHESFSPSDGNSDTRNTSSTSGAYEADE
jgi:hypothetical protein